MNFEKLLNDLNEPAYRDLFKSLVAEAIDEERRKTNLQYIVENAIIGQINDTSNLFYTERHLIAFGNYVLNNRKSFLDGMSQIAQAAVFRNDPSTEQKFKQLFDERLNDVTHADLCNWRDKEFNNLQL